MSYNCKPIPTSVLVFGAADHIGGPLAAYLTREAPSIRLRLQTRSEAKAALLRSRFPAAEVVIADYDDPASLARAVDGIEGVFVITPYGLDERTAMGHLVAALKASGRLVHLLRMMGLHPDENPLRIPAAMRERGLGIEVQHLIARQILDDSGLPVTHLNCGATFMDNLTRIGQGASVTRERKLIWPEHLITWIDPRDVAEVAGRLLLSDNHRHIGQFHTLNNGHDLMRYHEVAALMSEVWQEPIGYDGSREAFFTEYEAMGPAREMLWDYFQYEQDNEVIWARNDFVERTLGRKPTTLREWLIEHRDVLLGAPSR